MHRLLYWFLCVLLIPHLSACSEDAVPESPPEVVGRSVLVYMSAHNNLGYASTKRDYADIDEMLTAAARGDLGHNRLIVFQSPWTGNPQLKEITSEGIRVLKTYPPDFIPVEEEAMKLVFEDFKAMAPATSYGLILWGHGSGWVEDGLRNDSPIRKSFGAYQTGTNTHIWMNATSLARILQGENFDFLYFDCCFMASVEVAYQLRNAVPYIIASASEIPAEGMPYHKSLRYLMSDLPDLVAAANATFSHFDAMTGYNRTCTMSVIDTSALNALASAVRDVYANLNVPPMREAVQQFASHNAYEYFNRYFDLEHSVELIANENAIGTIRQILSQAVIYKANTPYLWQSLSEQVKINHHCGLTTFLPTTKSELEQDTYSGLDWQTDVASALF